MNARIKPSSTSGLKKPCFCISHTATITRARKTSNMKLPAAAIAVVSEVNPDKSGAFLFPLLIRTIFFILLIMFSKDSFAQTHLQNRTAINNAIYNNMLVTVTPMLFYHIELGMRYDTILNIIGKSALYCDSSDSYCNIENGAISKRCINATFIQPNKTWWCHWQGSRLAYASAPYLKIWFVGDHVTQVTAQTKESVLYTRDAGNTVHIEKTR